MIFRRNKKQDQAAAEIPTAAPAAPVAAPPAAAPVSAAPATAPAGSQAEAASLNDEEKQLLARRALGAKMMAASFGEIITVLMRSNNYKHYSLSDLDWLVIPPVLTQQFVLAEARKGDHGIPAPVGVALWASVSEEVDQKLSANTSGPLRLRPDEWKSGDILWLIDAVGPPQLIEGLIANLHKSVFKGRPLKVRSRDEEGKPVIKIQKLPADVATPAAS